MNLESAGILLGVITSVIVFIKSIFSKYSIGISFRKGGGGCICLLSALKKGSIEPELVWHQEASLTDSDDSMTVSSLTEDSSGEIPFVESLKKHIVSIEVDQNQLSPCQECLKTPITGKLESICVAYEDVPRRRRSRTTIDTPRTNHRRQEYAAHSIQRAWKSRRRKRYYSK